MTTTNDLRTCTACAVAQPETEFAIKRGGRAWRCKSCQNLYNHDYHADLPDECPRRTALAERATRRQAELRLITDAARAIAVCGVCGGTTDLQGTGTLTGRSLSDLVRREDSVGLEETLRDVTWKCLPCCGFDLGSSRKGISTVPGAPTVKALVASLVTSTMKTGEIRDAVLAVRSTSAMSVAKALKALLADGTIIQVSRGRYAPRPVGEPGPLDVG